MKGYLRREEVGLPEGRDSVGGTPVEEPQQPSVGDRGGVEAASLLRPARILRGEAVGVALEGDAAVGLLDVRGAGAAGGQSQDAEVVQDPRGKSLIAGPAGTSGGGCSATWPRLGPSPAGPGLGGRDVGSEPVAGHEAAEDEDVAHAAADTEGRDRRLRPEGEAVAGHIRGEG